jgi:hypothetical protein
MYDSSSGDTAALGSFLGGLVVCYVLFVLVLIAATVFVYYKIFQKTGNSGWMALLMLVPLVNLGMFLFLAFSDWPVLRENRELKARLGYPPSGVYPPSGGYGAPTAYVPQQVPAPPYAPVPAPYVPPVAPQAPPYSEQPPSPQIPPGQPPIQP